MKKKIIVISILLVVIVIAFFYFKNIFGWYEFKSNNYTLKENKSIVKVSKEQYSKDSLNLVLIIKNQINAHKNPYDNALRVNDKLEYINDSLTKIYIDSIFYSPKLDKVVFLVLVENDNKKLYKGMTKAMADGWEREGNLPYLGTHFNSSCFIAKRINGIFEIYYYGYSFTNSRTYKENSTALRDACLNHREDENESEKKYNVDDRRFWNSNEWVMW